MNKEIIKFEVKQRKKALIWWCVSVCALLLLTISQYPTFQEQAESINELLKSAPSFIQNQGDVSSPTGYLSTRLFSVLLPLVFASFCIGLGGKIIATDEESREIEMVLARPVSRLTLLTSKLLAFLAQIGILTIVVSVTMILMSEVVNLEVALWPLVTTITATVLLGACLGTIALAITAVAWRSAKSAVGIASGIGIAGFLFNSLLEFADWLEYPAKLLPFYHYQAKNLLEVNGGATNLWYYAFIIAFCIIISYTSFTRRDLE